MGNKRKLLDKPLKTFTVYALLILCLSIPAYFLVIDFIWISELDEHNEITKNQIVAAFNKADYTENDLHKTLEIYNLLQPGNTITEIRAKPIKPDTTYTILKPNQFSQQAEFNRFRVLESYFLLHEKNYKLTVQTNFEEADETLIAITLVTILFFFILVIGFIMLNNSISRKIWKPFQDTLYRLKHFDLNGRKEIVFVHTEIKEFDELHQELSKLIKRNVKVYEQQKVFLENASHELQTPLAVLKSKTDSMLQTKFLTQEQLEIINEMSVPLSRASRINKNLLLLAKIENQYFEENEAINLEKTFQECLEMLGDYIEDRCLKVTLEVEEIITIKCNRTLFESLINNLLINAIRHNFKKGEINVNVKKSGFEISNSGTTPLKSEILFERFSTNSVSDSGSGLGLAIVKEITKSYGWEIKYSFSDQMHIFSLYI